MISRIALILMAIPLTLFAIDYPVDRYRFKFHYPPGDSVLRLGHKFVIPHSEEIIIGGINLLRNEEYRVDYLNGIITLKRLPEDSVKAIFEVFPWNLRRYYFHRVIPRQEIAPPEKSPPMQPPMETEKSPFVFRRSGSVFRSVTIGSDRDASLESGMQMNLNGRLGKGATITAVLSDQSIPLQPEGNTRTLEEIDKVYVRVESENLGLNLGDYNLQIKDREFASLDRKLTGVQGYGEWNNYRAMISGAASKGEFRSESFSGIEGLQGPYQLHDSRGESGILILAGTEKVWIDGKRLIRGDNYDYIIEYSQGEITFTERIPINSDSRIVVDFEYASGDYSRNFYHSAGEGRLLRDRLKLYYTLAHEADSRNNPLSLSFTQQDRESLKSAGEDPLKAAADGAEYVGEEMGDYNRVPQADTFHYEWGGREQGDYDVSFSFMGIYLGSYTREFEDSTGLVFYQYVGTDSGDYEPVILLPLPRSHSMADFGFSYNPRKGVSLNAEGAVSNKDLNTYSGIGDGDNTGSGFNGNIRLDSLRLPSVAGLNPTAEFYLKTRQIDDNFRTLDRSAEIEYDRKWGYQDTLSQGEESYEFRAGFSPAAGLKFFGGGGSIVKGGFSSQRLDGGFNFKRGNVAAAEALMEDIRTKIGGSEGYWRRAQGNMWRKFGAVEPGFQFRGEDRSQTGEGCRYGEYRPSVKIGREKGLLAEYTYRDDDIRQNGALQSLSILNRFHLLYEKRFDRNDLAVDFTHSERDYKLPDSADVKSDIGRVELTAFPFEGAVDLRFQHRITQSRTATLALIPVEVSYGEGTHVKIGDQYYPDPNGNYLLFTQQTGEFTRSAKVRTSFNIKFTPARLKTEKVMPALWKLISTDTYFSVNEENRTGEQWRLYLLYLPAFRSDSTLYGTQTFRQDVYYRRGGRDFSLRLRFLDNRSLNNRMQSSSERRFSDEVSLRLWKSLSGSTNLQSEIARRREFKWIAGILDGEIISYWSENQAIHQVRRPLEIRMGMNLAVSRDRADGISARIFSLYPQANYSIFKRGKIIVEAKWTGVYSESENIPYEMADGRVKGSNYTWAARVNLRLGKNLNLSASYNGESRVGRPVIHTGRMELRAFF